MKTSDPKTPAMDYSACKGKDQKEYVPEDTGSEPKTPAADSSAHIEK